MPVPVPLSLQHISKRFAATLALDDVTVDVAAGEVHALLGENGAGKSTLMRIAYGMLAPDSGTIEIARGQAVIRTRALASPRAARDAGIGMVHQHFTSIPAFTVSENIALAAGWPETGPAAERRAARVIERVGLHLDVTRHVESLSVQLRQRLEIVKALAAEARVLLLDEPTAVLAPREVDQLLAFLSEFAGAGGAVLLITHKLEEVFRVAGRVTVLRRGTVTGGGVISGQTESGLVRAMIGDEPPLPARREVRAGETLVTASRLCLRSPAHPTGQVATGKGPAESISDASVSIRAGEIVGVAAIEGNGQRELLRAIAGVDGVPVTAGALEVNGPIGFIPEDRITEGLIPEFTLSENVLLGMLWRSRWWLDWDLIRQDTGDLLAAHDIRAAGPDAACSTLSGGNQQKLVFAIATAGHPRVIVAEDPTRGLDVQAAAAIHDRLRRAARDGAAVIVHSSDLDEVLALADRLIVVARGRIRELPVHAPRDVVGDAMLGIGTA